MVESPRTACNAPFASQVDVSRHHLSHSKHRQGLDRARSHAAAVPFGADALSAADLQAAQVEPVNSLAPSDAARAEALQLWLLAACQLESRKGGMRDKPGKGPDYYHTCYCLSGLAISQQASGRVLGGLGNRLVDVDVACNVTKAALEHARAWVQRLEQ